MPFHLTRPTPPRSDTITCSADAEAGVKEAAEDVLPDEQVVRRHGADGGLEDNLLVADLEGNGNDRRPRACTGDHAVDGRPTLRLAKARALAQQLRRVVGAVEGVPLRERRVDEGH